METDISVHLLLEATVSPSEDAVKVTSALKSIVPDADVRVVRGGTLARVESGRAKDLEHLREQLRDRQVRAAARRFLILSRDGNTASLLFNRQAAAAGVVALCGNPGESPLGPIVLRMKSERMDDLIDWLAGYPPG